MKLRLATRGSALAWTQSDLVAQSLRALGHEVELVRITTHGDVSTAPLASLGGAGVFVGAVRAALLDGAAELAVHSFKDLPTAPADGIVLAAVPQREDPADVLCSRDGRRLRDLPPGARIGTGSPRRAAQVRVRRPDLTIVEIRGNVETRLRRITEDLDAVLLAAAGLRRLGRTDAITERLDPGDFLPAPAQGALAIECRADAPTDLIAALTQLDHPESRLAALAERAVLARLEAGCAAPVAAHASVAGGRLSLAAAVVAVDGSRRIVRDGDAPATDRDATGLGAHVADLLLAAGAAALVELGASKPKPLAGRRILLPARSPAGTSELLTAAGAEIVTAGFTRQEALPLSALESAMAESWDWVVISSANAVATLVEAGFDLPARLAGANVAAAGPATAAALAAAGVTCELVAEPGGGAALAAAFPPGPGRVLLPGAEQSSTEPAAGLAAKAWTVRPVPVYRTVATDPPPAVLEDWRAGRLDAFVVTAGSVARAAIAAGGLPGPDVVAIGEPSAEAARAAGLRVVGVALRPDAGGLVDAVLAALTAG